MVLGDDLGLSSLLINFTDDTFSVSYVKAIDVDFKIKKLDIDSKRCIL